MDLSRVFDVGKRLMSSTAVLVSGGVDSSVALALLCEQGQQVSAFYLKIWLEDELAYLGNCPWEEDLAYAQAVCDKLGVPLEVISLQKEYWDEVVSYTIDSVKKGLTPNPDVLCNQRVKFGAFFRKLDRDFDFIATGHYAQKVTIDGVSYLSTAADAFKDQTYFLAQLSQAQLSKAIFPIGHLPKAEVRERARALGLATQDRKDSQGICFLGKISFNDFLKHHLGTQEGNLVEHETGKIMGKHEGFWFYTIGQRRGIGLSGGPWYVVAKRPEENVVVISKNYFEDTLERNQFFGVDAHWFSGTPITSGNYLIKIRHGENYHQAAIEMLDDTRMHITLVERDQGIAPGQFMAIYHEGRVVGSAVISLTGKRGE